MYVFYNNGPKLTELCRNMVPQYILQFMLGVFGGKVIPLQARCGPEGG